MSTRTPSFFVIGAGLVVLAVVGCLVGFEVLQRKRFQETAERVNSGLKDFVRDIRLEPTADKDLRLAAPTSKATGRFMFAKIIDAPRDWNGQTLTWGLVGVPTEFGSYSFGVDFSVRVVQRRNMLMLGPPEVVVTWAVPVHDSLRPILDRALGGPYRIDLLLAID